MKSLSLPRFGEMAGKWRGNGGPRARGGFEMPLTKILIEPPRIYTH
ncbi:hypothetical protein BH23THE1_BH23THE1_09110 [soil metagenome]